MHSRPFDFTQSLCITMLAFTHPFYNRDVLGLIMRACMQVGPVTARRLGCTYRLGRDALKHIEEYPVAMMQLYKVACGIHPNEIGFRCYDAWLWHAKNRRSAKGIPAWVRDEGFYEVMLTVCGKLLCGFAKPTARQCLLACTQDGLMLKYVPKELRCEEIIVAAIKCNWRALQYVENASVYIRTRACQINGEAIQFVPGSEQTEEMAACAARDGVLSWTSKRLLTRVICLTACIANPRAFGSVPMELRDHHIYDICSRLDVFAEYKSFPRRAITQDRLAIAISRRGCDMRRYLEILHHNHIKIAIETWSRASGWKWDDIPLSLRSMRLGDIARKRGMDANDFCIYGCWDPCSHSCIRFTTVIYSV